MTRTNWWCALVVSVVAMACGSPESQPTARTPNDQRGAPNGPLAAEQRESIRGVGRAVLLARRDSVEDPEIVALAREVDALRGDIESVLRLAPTPLTMAGDGPSADAASDRAYLGRADEFGAVRARVEEVRLQRVLLAAKAGHSADPVTSARAAALVSAADRIEAEAREALDAPDGERRARLAKLHRRLRRQGVAERRMATNDGKHRAAFVTPASSTFTKHR